MDIQRKLYGTCNEDLVINHRENGASEKAIADALNAIKRWYERQPHLPPNALDDDFLVRYYVCSKYSLEKTKKKIDAMLTARAAMPEFYTNRDPFGVDIKNANKHMQQFFVPKLTEDRLRILITRYTDEDPSEFDPVAAFKLLFMIADQRMKYDTCIGDVYVWDLRHATHSHVLKTTPSLLKKVLLLAQNCYGSRIHSIYLLNLPTYAKSTIAVIKTFMKKKMADRLHVIDSLEQLHRKIPADCLPVDFGGSHYTCEDLAALNLEAMQTEEWVAWYRDSETKKVDESKRPQEIRSDDTLGMMGSFKKLDID